jgi:hypothetical protein
MMLLLLQWRRPDPQVTLRWSGPSRMLAVQIAARPDAPIAAIIGPMGSAGPSGPAGPDGPTGQTGPAYDLDNAVIDGGTFN